MGSVATTLVFTLNHVFTARNEAGARLCFYKCLWFCSQEGSVPLHAGIHPPPPRPEAGTLPRTRGRHPPRTRGRHPSSRRHPPRLGAGTPVPPPSRHPPGADPPVQCMLGDTGNKRAVSILLECNLLFHNFCLIRRIQQEQIWQIWGLIPISWSLSNYFNYYTAESTVLAVSFESHLLYTPLVLSYFSNSSNWTKIL